MAPRKKASDKATDKPVGGRSRKAAPVVVEEVPAPVEAPVEEPVAPLIDFEAAEARVAARKAMDEAHAAVQAADRAVRSAYAYQGDFRVRDENTAKAREALAQARQAAADATEAYHALKYGS